MKLIKTLLLVGSLAFAPFGLAQVTIQDFSSVINANTFFYGSWEASGNTAGTVSPNASFVQGVGIYDVTSATATNSDTSKIEFFFSSPFSIGSNTYLEVTAQALALNAASSFQVVLIDTNAVTATATFNATSFLTGSYSTAAATFTAGGGFLANSIDSMIITGAIPSGTARFDFSFDKIAAVATPTVIPEPSTYAAIFGSLALGFVAYRRRNAVRV